MSVEKFDRAVKIIKEYRQTHIDWRLFFEENPSLESKEKYKHLGGAVYHKKCIEDYDFLLYTTFAVHG